MNESTLSLIAAVGGVVAAVGGLFAAIAAFRSAGVAKSAAEHAQEVERRSLLRDVSAAAQSVIAESLRIDDLSNNLKRAYRQLSTFAGQTGGSRENLHIEEVEKKQRDVGPLQQKGREFLENHEALRSMSEENLTESLTQFEGYLTQIRRVKEKLSQDLASVEQQNQLFREKAIKGAP